ncbi:PAAR domain-containing protein [Cupriavidus sp. 30B13]|uniref:PAAR domain-containing protein n=1 Tax=Cupriavidus sp. 30B13 TaxID=3384241 RepID=UPI003B9183FB
MTDMRRALRNGDDTSTKGTLTGTGTSTHDGRQFAVEGDFATCPACGKGGPVFNDCHPRFTLMGKTILVEGARVHCKCPESPVVLPSQSTFTIQVDIDDGSGRPAVHERYASASSGSDQRRDSGYNERYVLKDAETGEPIRNAAYAIQRGSGKIEHGTTDAEGRTHLLAAIASAENVSIFLEG